MYRLLYLSFFLSINLFGQKITFTIAGKLLNPNNSTTLYINGTGLIDSLKLKANKPFYYVGKLDNPGIILLHTKDTYNTELWINKGPLKIEIYKKVIKPSSTGFLIIDVLSASKETIAYSHFIKIRDSLLSKYPKHDVLDIDSAMLKFYPLVKGFVQKNKNSFLSMNMALVFPFNLESKRELLSFTKDNPDKMDLETLRKEIHRSELLQRGKLIANFTLPTPAGNLSPLYSLKGRYILIQFWSSDCIPCRWENPDLINIYTKYKSKGFEIYGISLDHKSSEWISAIEKDHLPWLNVSDLSGWQNSIVKDYNIDHLPFNVLVDGSFKVIASEIWPSQLNQILSRYLDK